MKVVKRLLETNVGADGTLDTDKVVAALLQLRNTPDRECRLSPAQVLFGRSIRDALPKITTVHAENNIRECWRSAWAAKEDALRSRLIRN